MCQRLSAQNDTPTLTGLRKNPTNGGTKLWWRRKRHVWWQIVRWCVKIITIWHKKYHKCQRLSAQNGTATLTGPCKISTMGAQSYGAKKPPCFDDKLFDGASKLTLFAIKIYHTCQRLSAQNDTPTLNRPCKISPIGAQSWGGKKNRHVLITNCLVLRQNCHCLL